MAKLVIVESPAKAKTIGKYLGKDYEVTASMGHIRDLPASQLGIDIEHDYAPQYISIKGKDKLIALTAKVYYSIEYSGMSGRKRECRNTAVHSCYLTFKQDPLRRRGHRGPRHHGPHHLYAYRQPPHLG